MIRLTQNDVVVQKDSSARIFHNYNSSNTPASDYLVVPEQFDTDVFEFKLVDDDNKPIYQINAHSLETNWGNPTSFSALGFDNATHDSHDDPTVVTFIDIYKDEWNPNRELIHVFFPTYWICFTSLTTGNQGKFLLKSSKTDLITYVANRQASNPFPICYNTVEAGVGHLWVTYAPTNLRIGHSDALLWFSGLDINYQAVRVFEHECHLENWYGI